LIELNLELYSDYAAEFSDSRTRLQPGIMRALAFLGNFESLVDLGCGDARVGRKLLEGSAGPRPPGFEGLYLGVDACAELLALAPDTGERFQLVQADLTEEGWVAGLPRPEGGFQAMVLFSVLHHIPGRAQRLRFLQECASLLSPEGRWALSVWQCLHLERFRQRVVPWSRIGLREDEVEKGDILQDWRRGGRALRYVHSFGRDELVDLCAEAGLGVSESFRSDGESADLGLYVLGDRA
jgi:SAM-dependent methyltransferase